MKKINVIVKDPFTLVLQENAEKGDIIDIRELPTIDSAYINAAIQEEKNSIYNEKLNKEKEVIAREYQQKIENIRINCQKENLELQNNLKAEIKDLQFELEKERNNINHVISEEKHSIEIVYSKEIANLKEQINNLLKDLQIEKEKKENEIKAKVSEAKQELQESFNKEKDQLKDEFNKEKDTLKDEFNKEKDALKDEHFNELKNKDNEISELKRAKASLSNKFVGEDLEIWCAEEMHAYMQNGFENCKWYKDNIKVKEEDETKGTKADFIFEVYRDENTDDKSNLITSVCLEMKNESPDSKTKKVNEDFYKKLDDDRRKKNCKYAVLVSDLENAGGLNLPIYKVREYKDMYVVKPSYMVVLLNLIVSLSTKFAHLLNAEETQELNLATKNELIAKFESLKKSYLEDPLTSLEKHITEIEKHSGSIIDTARKIETVCDNITRSFIENIHNKLDKFDIKVNTVRKKLAEDTKEAQSE